MTRRRLLTIAAFACGMPLTGKAAEAPPVTWTGEVLGTVGTSPCATRTAWRPRASSAAPCRAAPAGGLFKPLPPDSLLVELNVARRARPRAPAEMRHLLEAALRFAALTGGAFDPTCSRCGTSIAPISRSGRGPRRPPAAEVAEALGRVGHRHLRVGPDAILLARRAWR